MEITTHAEAPVHAAARAHSLVDGGLVGLLVEGRRLGAIDLAAGTPGYPEPPGALLGAAADAVRAGHNQYEHPAGNRDLRARVAATLRTPADPETELTMTVGATEALCVALLSIVDPGDEVAVFEPFFENFASAVALAGGRLRTVPLHPPAWRFDPGQLAAAFGARTRAVILNTPHNPTGRVFNRAELDLLAELCQQWNTTVICDEVYAAYTFGDRRHLSPADLPALRDRSIVIGSFSKSHAVSGWRLGYLRAAPGYTTLLRRVHVATTGGAAAPLQHAVLAAELFTSEQWNPASGMQQRAAQMLDIARAAGLRAQPPEGGCYLLADIRPVTGDSAQEFARRLLREAGVLVAPGEYFHVRPESGSAYIRFAFNREPRTLAAAGERLTRFGR